jgi:signal transduction histidine kinase
MEKEVFYIVALVSVFFILLIVIIIITAILYHSRKKLHQMEVSNFQAVLMHSQLEIQEQTLQTMGADLHDNIGQLLSLTSLTLKSIELDDQKKSREKVDNAIDLIIRSIKELRHLGKLMHGQQILKTGIENAIGHEISWIEKSGKFKVTYGTGGDQQPERNTDKDLIIFRILQEILNNIIKHSEADRIGIDIRYFSGLFELLVSDNGKGFDLSGLDPEKAGMGLANIYRRVSLLKGEAKIDSSTGNGTTIKIQIPYP